MSDFKVWWVYAGQQYYPRRIFGDLQSTHQNEIEALKEAERLKNLLYDDGCTAVYDWAEAIDVSDYLV